MPTPHTSSITIRGRTIRRGAILTIKGERGRFQYLDAATLPNGTVMLTVFGGRRGQHTLRSFTPERVRAVRPSAVAARN